MQDSYGTVLRLTVCGESHGKEISARLTGIPAGVPVPHTAIRRALDRRAPKPGLGTARREADEYRIAEGISNDLTTGEPLTLVIPNRDVDPSAYQNVLTCPRPGHGDYPVLVRDGKIPSGGGHYSGRLTAAIVAACAFFTEALLKKGIVIAAHLLSVGQVQDRLISDVFADSALLSDADFPTVDETAGNEMQALIRKTAAEGDSIGGIVEVVIGGVPAGVGEPWFDTTEGELAKVAFSIPGVKGVSFGDGFSFGSARGSEVVDAIRLTENGVTVGPHNGGINAGLTNGDRIRMLLAVKPTPTISKPVETVDFSKNENVTITYRGRHDPCIAPRVCPVAEALSALAVSDLLVRRYGTAWLFSEKTV